MNVCRYRNAEHIGSYGLLYRYANKSRRKVPSVILLILLPLLFSMPFSVCAGDDRVVRVDPLGTILDLNPFYQTDTFSYQFSRSSKTFILCILARLNTKFNFHSHSMMTSTHANADECVNFRRNIEKSIFYYSTCT